MGRKPKLLRIEDVAEALTMSVTAVRRLIADGRFPGPVKLSPRENRWLPADVKRFIRELDAERDEDFQNHREPQGTTGNQGEPNEKRPEK